MSVPENQVRASGFHLMSQQSAAWRGVMGAFRSTIAPSTLVFVGAGNIAFAPPSFAEMLLNSASENDMLQVRLVERHHWLGYNESQVSIDDGIEKELITYHPL